MAYKVRTNVKLSKLKKMRNQRGLSQKQLSMTSGVPLKCIGNYEQLRRDINHAQAIIVYRLAIALDCDIIDLLDI